ncbi:unnamed protein product [Nezara viridula]|uniref:Histone-lysine N-methyltransferase ASH1L n=1 Tax=Nezara viridula TaxID=85310 RepID=A0A9P0MWN8_NEZVI|nr:unnamed protein product [Nezara viridula]
MEYYIMPQVDKSASTYSPPVQYVPALPSRPELNKYGVSSDILTSCDWSAVIHRPAEDSEPEDLPSTVDMDAIKEPATPLPPLTPVAPPVSEDESESDEEESSNSDSDSSSDSNSESQGSGSGSRSSDSSDESSGKKESSSSSESQSTATTFSIRETNFDQGGLKLKISATKPKTPKPRSSSSSSDPYDSSSSEDEGSDTNRKKPEPTLPVRTPRKEDKEKQSIKVEKKIEKLRRRPKVPSVKQRALRKRPQSRPCRRSPRAKPSKESGSGARGGSSSSSTSSSSSESDDEEEEEPEKNGDDIVQLAQQLGAPEHPIPISEHLQVINQEDLAAILPDVGAGSLDGFDASAQPAPPDSLSPSSSDTELLPEQVVSDAISRIQIDSDPGREEPPPSSHHSTHDDDSEREEGGGGYSSNLLEDFVEKTEMLSRGGGGSGGGGEDKKTEAGAAPVRRKRGRPPKPRPPSELEAYPAQSNVSPDSGIQSVAGSPAHHPSPVASPDPRQRLKPPVAVNDEITKMQTTKGELRLEHGGKRGPGRPKGSGKMRKKRGKPAEIKKPVVLPPAATELKVPPYIAGSIQATQIPSLPGISKRGRGRPKKTPPVLEPIIPHKEVKQKGIYPRLPVGPKGLMRVKQHKHKKRKHRPRELTLDPKFIAEVDKLANEFEKCSISLGFKPKFDGGIPSVFRVKKVLKKKKGNERPKTSDKESGSEVIKEEAVQQREKTAAVAVSPAHSSVITKKRIKKSAVEIPKNREKTETANNEQRLPLKKRHYHISSATPTNNDSAEKSDSSVELNQSKTVVKANLPPADKPLEKHSTKGQISAKGNTTPTTNSGKSIQVAATTSKASVQASCNSLKSPTSVISSGKGNQSVIASVKGNSPKPSPVAAVATRSATKTASPIDINQGKAVTKPTAPGSEKTSEKSHSSKSQISSKSASTHSLNVAKSLIQSPSLRNRSQSPSTASKGSQSVITSGKGSQSVITSVKSNLVKSVTSAALMTRSASKVASPSDTRNTIKNSTPVTEKSSEKNVSKSQLSSNKTTNLNSASSSKTSVSTPISGSKTNSQPLATTPKASPSVIISGKNAPTVITSVKSSLAKPSSTTGSTSAVALGTRSATKVATSSPVSATVAPSPQPKVTESVTTKVKAEKKPPAGVFEPSAKVGGAEALEKIIKTPEIPVKCVEEVISKIKERLQPVKDLEGISVEVEPVQIKRNLDEDDINKPKKRRVICDVRVHVTKLSQSDFPLQDVLTTMGKHRLKMKRKKSINRTGFPVKKKKKKKLLLEHPGEQRVSSSPPVLEDQTKLSIVTSVNDSTPALSPVAKQEAQKVKDEPKADIIDPKLLNPICIITPVQELVKEESKSCQPSPCSIDIKIQEEKFEVPVFEDKPVADSITVSETIEKENDTKEHEEIAVEKTEPIEKTKTESITSEEKLELKPSNKRTMELRSKTVASERRKRKSTTEEPENEQTEVAISSTSEIKTSISKRLRRHKEEQDDSDADSVKLRRKHPPRWKKKYLPAGLLSDYFKEDEPRKPSTSDPIKFRTTYNRAEHEFGLLPPPAYCSKWVRQRKIHFQLPYDLWWLHMNNQLPGRDSVPSWNYKKIRTNVYFDVKPTLSYEAQSCSCKPSSGCGEECINRMVLAECSPQFCPCKENCSNQKIQKHEWAPGLMKFMTKDKGWGVKTKYGIKKDDFILEYVGEVVSEREFKARMASRYQNDTHHYCLNLDSGLVIDGHRMGGEGRFVNHSCEPNCEMQKWCVNGLFRMALFALRDIDANEELSYDYNFALFNPAEGQPCKCGSSKCRGVIGGKWQRVAVQRSGTPSVSVSVVTEENKQPGQVGRPRKNSNRRKTTVIDKKQTKPTKDTKASSKESCSGANALATVAARLNHLTPVKPLSHQQKTFVSAHRCFLIRNLEKVRVLRERLKQVVKGGVAPSVVAPSPAAPPQQQVFLTQLTALSCPRSIRTRRLAQAQENPEMTKTARLACIFKNLYTEVVNAKDEKGESLSTPFMNLPSKKKCADYYTRIQNPLDLTMIESNITTGVYKTVESFDDDMMTVFKNAVRWHGRTTDLGIAAARLRKIYNLAKLGILESIEEILGTSPPPSFIPPKQDPGAEEEDVIRCICGLFRDEGVMIQCERCLVWQHSWCVRANTSADEYLCERCSPRSVDLEVPAQPEHQDNNSDQVNYITLLRGELQLKQGDTVYVLRDIVNEESKTVPKEKHTYKTIKNWKYTDCDIFRIERLWKDSKGDRFAFGHHYLRPHETFHEPTRRFFPNELMRVPLYEVVPVDLVMGHCTVLDLNTYCKGRPIGSSPQHTYICEYRVDKNARIFAKIPKPKSSNICTKSYAFETYDVRLKPQRNYAPHGLVKGVNLNRGRGCKSANNEEASASTLPQLPEESPQEEDPVAKREKQKTRLNGFLLKLLARLPSKAPLDLSYLLEPGRRQRKKPPLLAS